jgi:hypothetical protein
MKTQTIVAMLITSTMCQFTTGVSRAQDAGAAPPARGRPATDAAGEVKGGPGPIIQEKIRSEVAARLAEAGAGCDALQVTVAVRRDSATPYKVSYRGLRNFKGADGTTPEANGAFIMEYIGGGQWQGALAGTRFTATVGSKDNIDLPFVNDPHVLGEWESVDFVADISNFNPAQPSWNGKLYLKGLTFLEDGKMPQAWWTWTKGVVIHHGDQTASHYEIREINGHPYLFFEWKSGDVTIARMKPHYYVLKPKAAKGTS